MHILKVIFCLFQEYRPSQYALRHIQITLKEIINRCEKAYTMQYHKKYIIGRGSRGSSPIVVDGPAALIASESLAEMQTLRSFPGLLNQNLKFIEFLGDLYAY